MNARAKLLESLLICSSQLSFGLRGLSAKQDTPLELRAYRLDINNVSFDTPQ
jgi:hypothetical protein